MINNNRYMFVPGVLTYYQLDAQGSLFTRQIFVGPNLFTSGGSIWLGQWHITHEHISGVPLQPFVGSIDELRLWAFVMDSVIIRQSFLAVITVKQPELTSLWRFDEGEGASVRNLVSGSSDVYLPDVVSRRPEWRFSYARNVAPEIVVSTSVQFTNFTLETLATKLCFELIYDANLVTSCGRYLNISGPQFYYKACLGDVHSSNSLHTAYIALAAYADYCQSVLHLLSWPAQHMCHQFPKMYQQVWIGPSCRVKCVFGNTDQHNDSLCVCNHGYWGDDCASECPGGGNNPCNAHGACDVTTGSCECDLNWRGNSECSNCTPGWTGSQCSVAVAKTQFPTCSAFTGGHFTTFDSAHFNFFGVGEFWFIRSDLFNVQIRQIPCENGESRCINAAAFSFSTKWDLVFHAPFQDNEQPIIWLNNILTEYSSTRLEISNDFYLDKSSSTTYKLQNTLQNIDFRLRIVGREIVIAARVPPSYCNGTRAVCGNCDGNRNNDFNVTVGETLEQKWQVSGDKSLFIYHHGPYGERRTPTGGEYALKFNRVGVCSNLIPNVLNGSHITAELLFKTSSESGGVLFSYSKTTSLTLFLDVTLRVRIGTDTWNTRLSPDNDAWNHVTLVYNRATGTMFFYHINSVGVVRQATHSTIRGLFQEGSTISVGQWIPSEWGGVDVVSSLPGFVGLIDEVRFWNREFILSDVEVTWRVNVVPNSPRIAILWKFNEGQNNVIHDLVSGVHLYIPSVRNAPHWIFSYANIIVFPVNSIITFHNHALEVQAQSWCRSHVLLSPLSIACAGLGSGTRVFFYRACLRVVASKRLVTMGVTVVVAFADICQMQLNLTTWPARQMCSYESFKSTKLINWIGVNCDIPCIYGYQDPDFSNKCHCDPGFWGRNCSGVCPRGFINFCNRKGRCSPTFGTCTCGFKWQGAYDCSQCSYAFLGQDCSVSVIAPTEKRAVASAFGTGYYVTLDGVKFRVNLEGEFQVFHVARLGVSIQFRQVRVGGYVRLRCVAVRAKQSVIAIHSRIGAGHQVVVTLNGVPIDSKSLVTIGSSGFVFQRKSSTCYTIHGPGGFYFVIYSRAIHLDVSITMERWMCHEACGLFGRCKNPASSVQSSNCSVKGIADTYNLSTISKKTVITFLKAWTLPQNESLFAPVLNLSGEAQSNNGGGNCLFFNRTSVVTAPLTNVFVGNYITVQFFVKAKDPSVHEGTVISYALKNTFAVVVNKTVQIYFGTHFFDTQLVLEGAVWNHVSLVYRRSSGLLQVYVINSKGIIQTRIFFVGVGAFADGGTLAIALWQVTKLFVSVPGFVGWVDELSIWNKRFDSIMVQQSWNTNFHVPTPGMALLWKFNEGSGFICRAAVGGIDMTLPTPPWRSPVWYPSDVSLRALSSTSPQLFNETTKNSTRELCTNVFLKGPLYSQCSDAVGSSNFYYEACISEVSTSKNPASAGEIAIAFGMECQAALNLTEAPGQAICNILPGGRYDDWVGDNCTRKCVFGLFSDGTCTCESGYWGVNCSHECPGGAANACHDHGQCDVTTGECRCFSNWQGNQNCSECTPGWVGSSCSVAVATTDPSILNKTAKVCTISEGGFVVGFDGSLYTFTTVGEFLMITSPLLQVEVRQVPCGNGFVCLNAVGFRLTDISISLHAPYESDKSPVVHVNGEIFNVGGDPTNDMQRRNISIEPTSSNSYQIVLSQYVAIKTVFTDRYMSVESTVTNSFCLSIEGLCGSCAKVLPGQNETNTNGTSVLPGRKPKTVLEELGDLNSTVEDVDDFVQTELIVNSTSETPTIVIDQNVYGETRVVYGGLYSLHYQFTAVATQGLVNLFASEAVTIQLLVKSCHPRLCGGTLISYTSNVTFYISNHVTVTVVIGLHVFDTGISTETDQWNQVSVVFIRSRLELIVYVTSSSGLVQMRTFVVPVNPFVTVGTFAVGLWQPASGFVSVQPTNTFYGEIDEISVWKRPFDYALIKQSWGANIQPNAAELTNLWKFNDGESELVKDLVSGVTLLFPKYPLGKPKWVFSDAPIASVIPLNANSNNKTLQSIASKVCVGFIFQGPIFTACKTLGNVTLQFYLSSCVQAVVDSGLAIHSLDAVLTISDYCKRTLRLSFWPAQPLCNKFPGRKFPKWIGKNCTTPCIFGQALNESDVCVCDTGFYGTNCSGICPGGKGRPCYNHGVCDAMTGKCLCQLNWRGNENCSACSSGWIGTDCSIAITQWSPGAVLIGVGAISIGGHFSTFSGVSYSLHVTGEYYLIYSVHTSVTVQIRLVTCFGQLSCVNSIALRMSSHNVVLHGPYTSGGKLVIWLDGKVIDVDLKPINVQLYGFYVHKLTADLWEVSYPGLHVKIRVTGRYLSLSTSASDLLCEDAIGLLGSCHRGLLEALLSYQPIQNCSEGMFVFNGTASQSNELWKDQVLPLGKNVSDSKNNTQDIILALVTSNLKVKKCHSLFLYEYGNIVEYRDANSGYALYFNHTTVVSSAIYKAFSFSDITIKIMFKTLHYGVIVSYTKIQTFFVTNEGGSFIVYFGNKIYHTNIIAELNEWNQISLVFRKSTGVLQFYYFASGGVLYRFDVDIGSDVFVPGGIIALAGWIPSTDGTGSQPTEFFTGFVDEVRIWTRYFHPAFILQTWNRSVSVETKDIAHAWKFNEGEGKVAIDKVTGMQLELPIKPWREPEWRYSDVVLQKPFHSKEQTFPFNNKTLETSAETFCTKILLAGPLSSYCKNLGPGLATFYYRSCLQRIASFGSLYMSMEIIIAYADYCQAFNNLTVWPAKPLCNEFPGRNFPIWFGDLCDRRCMFGEKRAPRTCVCYHGYWGPECSRLCPGGATNPCNNNGLCDSVTGACHCYANWKGTPDCGICSPGWTGRDCSLALVSLPLRKVSVAISSTGAHYVTFDGYSFTLVRIGEYYLINVPGMLFQVHIRHVPCRLQSVCVNAIGIKVSSTVISFHAPYTTRAQPVIWVNNTTLIPLSGLEMNLGPTKLGLQLRYVGRDHYLINWKDHFLVYIRIEGRYLGFKTKVESSYCFNSTGLLGSCDGNPYNDLKISSNDSLDPANATQFLLNKNIGDHLLVGDEDRFIVLTYKHYIESHLPAGGIYALIFNQTGASSMPLKKTFFLNVDVTFELLLKPFDHVGTVFSYAARHPFAITMDKSFRIYFALRTIDTGILVTENQWSHLVVVWHQKTFGLEFFHFSFKGEIQRRSYILSSNPFIPGGILSLGQWELSPGDNETRTQKSFVGVIDEVRVWKRAFNPALVQQNWRMNVLPTHPDVTALWKINEGESDIIRNLASDDHIYLPRFPWQQPTWAFSDADVNNNLTSSERPFEINFPNKTFQSDATSFCHKLFYKTNLYDQCHHLQAELEFHYLVCTKYIATVGNMSAALTAVVAFSDHCQDVTESPVWPAQPLCNMFPLFPFWIGNNCDIECIFGTAHPNDRNLCVCMGGYWGKDCSQVCPGGILSTCGGHGWCDTATGLCNCEVNWRGNANCTMCSPGWYGSRCQLAAMPVTSLTSTIQVTASVGGHGHFTTFFGVSFSHRVVGEFYLLKAVVNNFVIQLRQAPCVTDRTYNSLCTTGLAIRFEDTRIVIRAPITSVVRADPIFPLLWLNGKLVQLDHKTQLSTFVMIRVSTVTFRIQGPQGITFVLTVGHSLALTLSLPHSHCQNATGLLGSCRDHAYNGSLIKAIKTNSAVQVSETLFVYQYLHYSEHRITSGGGFNLFFSDSCVRSGPMYFPAVEVITFELLVKLQKRGGVIFSYLNQQVFAVIDDKNLRVVYKGNAFDTGFELELSKWNQITLVYNQLVGILHFYHFSWSGKMRLRVFKLDTKVFANGGKLVLGQWQPSLASDNLIPESSFVGEIDEIRIWKRRTNSDLVKLNWRLNVEVRTYPDLLHLWKLNQVEERVVRDLLGKSDLFMIKFHEPLWTFSDSDIPRQREKGTVFNDIEFRREAESFCFALILGGPLYNSCQDLAIQVAQFYYKVCLHDISLSRNLTAAVYAVITFSDYCQATLNLTEWPAQKICHHFPRQRYPHWIGLQCATRCVFGYPTPDKNATGRVSCKCERGYWGPDCSNLCPGGLRKVCNGHGVCDVVNGTCTCEAHWNGTFHANDTSDNVVLPCSICTQGWTGSDCAVAYESSIQNSAEPGVAINFGDPHFTTVTGDNFHFEVPGAFQLFKSSSVEAQVLLVPCNNRVSCRRISEITLRTSKVLLSARYVDLETFETGMLQIARNRSSELSNSEQWIEIEDVKYRWLTSNILEVGFPEKIQFNILLYYGTLGIAIHVPRAMRALTDGICGEKESSWIRKFSNVSSISGSAEITPEVSNASSKGPKDLELSQQTLGHRLSSQFKLEEANNFLSSRHASRSFSGSGYMLEFLSSNTMVIFADNTSLPALEEFTIELWVCLVNNGSSVSQKCSSRNNSSRDKVTGGHAIFSTGTNSGDFIILYKNGIQVIWSDDDKFVTNLTIYEGIWTHIAVTWRTSDGRLQAFAYSDDNDNASTKFGVKVGERFSFDALLVLGRFMLGSAINTEYDLRGALDELRIWQYSKTREAFHLLMNAKFDVYHEGLVLDLPFDEGMGLVTEGRLYGLVPVNPPASLTESPAAVNTSTAQFFIHTGDSSPGWAPSGVPMTPLSNYSLVFRNQTLHENAFSECHKWFYTGVLQEHCSTRLVTQALFYYECCLADVADSGRLEHHKLSVSLFGFYCQKILGIEECLLHGTYDAFQRCPSEIVPSVLTPAEVAVIAVSVVLFILFVLIIIIVLCRRRKKKKDKIKRIYINEQDDDNPADMDEGVNGISLRQVRDLLDEYASDTESEGTPNPSPSVHRRKLIADPTGGVTEEAESHV